MSDSKSQLLTRKHDLLEALRVLEQDHLDGLLSSHTKGGRERAVGAWLRFLLLEPQSNLAPKVRRWIAQLEGRK